MKFFIALLTLSFLPLSAAFATRSGYEVELIIFKDAHNRYIQSEGWNYNDMLNKKNSNPAKEQKPDPEFKQLPWEGAKLAAKLKRLQNNSNYKVLATKRWKQTGLDRNHAFTIPIGKIAEQANNSETHESNLAPTQTQPYLTGNVKLIMSRYLHFNVDLKYIMPQLNDQNIEQNRVFPIVSERRMRSREIHYIDHPLVGIVVLATPYKIEVDESTSTSSEYKTM